MNARKLGLAFGLFGIGLLIASKAMALGRESRLIKGTWRDEGNVGILFNVAVTSSAWTAVPASTDSIRRAVIYQTDEGALASVCLATTTNSNDPCNASTPGIKLSTGATLSDYSGIQFYGRARSAGPAGAAGSVNVSGYWTRDTGDYGAISFPR